MFLVPVARRAPVLRRSFDRLFDDALFDRFLSNVTQFDARPTRGPALDVRETEGAYTVTLDLPGVAKGDVKVTIDGRRVDISAQPTKSDEKPDGDRVLYSERGAASFARSVTLPAEVDPASASATLDNGVLTLTLAKRQPASKQIEVR